MDPSSASTIPSLEAESLLRSFVCGERGAKLRSQLASLHPTSSTEEIEEAIQIACDRFLERAEGISAPGQVYAWIRVTAHRVLNREGDHHAWELTVDPSDKSLQTPAEDGSPEEKLIANEEQAELAALVHEVSQALPERKRHVLALYGAGCKRPQIASRLGMSERAVKRDLLEIMDEARSAIARKAGGGCERGEPLVLRFAYGLATQAEAKQARLHMSRCRRCEVLCERLDAWREKAGALLPAPAAEGASAGLLERLAHRTADGLSSVKQQLAGGATQAKQQAAVSYYRAVDPTPFAAVRPGTLAAVVASCLTIGGAATTYCVQQGVDPIGAVGGLIGGAEEPKPASPESEPTPAVAPSPPVSEEAPASEAAPPPEAETRPPPEPSPPPEQSFDPASPDYPATESAAGYSGSESPPAESRQPAPVPANEVPQFRGP